VYPIVKESKTNQSDSQCMRIDMENGIVKLEAVREEEKGGARDVSH
jgi:hypothetical protein